MMPEDHPWLALHCLLPFFHVLWVCWKPPVLLNIVFQQVQDADKHYAPSSMEPVSDVAIVKVCLDA